MERQSLPVVADDKCHSSSGVVVRASNTCECDEPQCKRVDKCYERLLGKITSTFAYL
ncbi:hypothetical protein DPMN_010479 [Dreissena polymorpha]|uniref:Uncharacterized protein n=1 Tax=Dreissena polymorpha TaxID=45954 RepID=A0A9D4RZ50_DREPO|nr:hypothetical protein DPMN_010479 [Dreissena polymorpha]